MLPTLYNKRGISPSRVTVLMTVIAFVIAGCFCIDICKAVDMSMLNAEQEICFDHWELSTDSSYPLDHSGKRMITGRILPAFTIDNGTLEVGPSFSSLQTQGFLRGLFFSNDEMLFKSEAELRVELTAARGGVVGVCFGADEEMQNGWAVILSEITGRVELMRLDGGILLSLSQYITGTRAILSPSAGTGGYELRIHLLTDKSGSDHVVIKVDGAEEINVIIPASIALKEGRGNRFCLFASDNGGKFFSTYADYVLIPIDNNLTCSQVDMTSIDNSFIGELSSEVFSIEKQFISFKIAGKTDDNRLVFQLINAETGEVLLSQTGPGGEFANHVLWNVTEYSGLLCKFRVIDQTKSGYLVISDIRLLDDIPLDSRFSLLYSQVGYSRDSAKKAFLRAPDYETGDIGDTFYLIDCSVNEAVYRKTITKLPDCWDSHWWLMDFSDFNGTGKYRLAIAGGSLISDEFIIQERALCENSLIDVALNQLDLRRAPGKMGWRDSSTNELRELHAQVMAVHTMLDLIEKQSDWLSPYQRARVADNIQWGLQYILSAQEITDNPLTNGRFIHDLYPSQYTAEKLRTWFDTVFSMTVLARAYPWLIDINPLLASAVKEAFDLSYTMCCLRPYYLEEEFYVESQAGRGSLQSAMIKLYGIKDILWEFDAQLRTRDKLMFAWACTLMYKADKSSSYLDTAREMTRQVCLNQYTDYLHPIDGLYGCFYEMQDGSEAMMLEWIQSTNLLLGNQYPTTMQPLIDLLTIVPGDQDAALWYNTVKTYTERYVKASASYSPLGIYPIAVYKDNKAGGVKFFQSLSHGATSHFGYSARNLMELALFFEDVSIQRLAENNVQFVIGLNPGFPHDTEHKTWYPVSLLYLIGNRSFRGYFHGDGYLPPIGSGFNGFSAAPQFSVYTIRELPDLPLGIIDKSGQFQFNEDYIPHGMGYASGVSAIEAVPILPIQTFYHGRPVSAHCSYIGDAQGSFCSDVNGCAVLSCIPAGSTVVLTLAYENVSVSKEYTAVSGRSPVCRVDFAENLDLSIVSPDDLYGDSTGYLTIQNNGAEPVIPKVTLLCDGAALSYENSFIEIQPGERITQAFSLKSYGKAVPFLVYAYVETPSASFTQTAGGYVR